MVDWLPIPALREMREISYLLHTYARRMIKEKKDEMKRDDDSIRHLMSVMRKRLVS